MTAACMEFDEDVLFAVAPSGVEVQEMAEIAKVMEESPSGGAVRQRLAEFRFCQSRSFERWDVAHSTFCLVAQDVKVPNKRYLSLLQPANHRP